MILKHLLLIGAIVAAVLGVLAAAVYWDAKQTGMDSPIKWAVFVFFTGAVGLFLYLSEHSDEVHRHNDMDPYSLPEPTRKNSEDDRN